MKKIAFVICFISLMIPGLSHAITEIKVALVAPEGSTWVNVVKDWDKELREKTSNRLGFKIYPGGVLGDEGDVLRKMQIGQVHAAGFTGLGLGMINPEVRILELPMMFQNYKEVDAVKDIVSSLLEQGFSKKGYALLGWSETGFVNIFSNKPIKSREDMSGMKMWMWEGDPLVKALYDRFDIVPTPLSIANVLTSLQTKLIDAVYAPPLGAIALQWFTRTKYMTDLNLANSTGAIIITSKMFNSIAPEDRKILLATAKKFTKQLTDKIRTENEQSKDVLKKNGISFVTVPTEQIDVIKKRSEMVWQDLVGKLYSDSLLKQVRDKVAGMRTN